MTAMDTTNISMETEPAERPVLHRTFEAELTAGDGRTVDVRIVPYGETADVSDGGPMYREQWMPGVFAHQTNAANRVLANFEHQTGIAGVVGHGLALREEPDGFHGSFRLHDTSDGDKTLMLVREGVLGGVSLEAVPVRSVRTAAGIVQRVKAHLKAVALCRTPAFTGAQVLAVRHEPDTIFDECLLPVDMDPDLVERCRQAGIELPQRYQAHPDGSGTPAATGTPDSDGTRRDQNNPTLEV